MRPQSGARFLQFLALLDRNQEDRLLIQAIRQIRGPFRWSNIAALVPRRTGKQCRERYFNHLKPALNRSEWTLVDDALLFHLHGRVGPKWSTIAALLRGRNNNNTKNRFHYSRRRLEKDVAGATNVSPSLRMKLLDHLPDSDSSDGTMDTIQILAHAIESKSALPTSSHDSAFDLVAADTTSVCRRCGLTVPSRQTGRMRCRRHGWCQSCTLAPAYLGSDLLRLAHVELHAAAADDAESAASGTM
jgi:Myb-like DNA-binding domain